jgi:hypothetical protein
VKLENKQSSGLTQNTNNKKFRNTNKQNTTCEFLLANKQKKTSAVRNPRLKRKQKQKTNKTKIVLAHILKNKYVATSP